MLTFEDFQKIELKVAKVVEAEKVEGADKLLKLTLDIGEEKRQIIAGVALWYEPENLIGKEIIIVANLEPRQIRGLESNGMLLAAIDENGQPAILSPDKEVPPGSKVR